MSSDRGDLSMLPTSAVAERMLLYCLQPHLGCDASEEHTNEVDNNINNRHEYYILLQSPNFLVSFATVSDWTISKTIRLTHREQTTILVENF